MLTKGISLVGADTSIIFVLTKVLLQQNIFVTADILLLQAYFCCDKKQILSWQTRICCDKPFVATKVILAAAPAKDKALL